MDNSRYFVNTMTDYIPGSGMNVDNTYWKSIIKITVDSILSNIPPVVDHCKGGLYVGCAGVAYMFHYLANSDTFGNKPARRQELLANAKKYTDIALTYIRSGVGRDRAGAFLHGDGGIYTVTILVLHALGLGSTPQASDLMAKYVSSLPAVKSSDYGSDEMFVGRAGYLCGLLQLQHVSDQKITTDEIEEVAETIITSGRTYSQKHGSPCPLMYGYHGKEYLGAAHGLSAILQMLMSCPNIVKRHGLILQQTVDFLLGIRQTNGNMASNLEKAMSGVQPSDSRELVHWCHGAAGVVYLFARAFVVWGEPRYLEACQTCGELVWQKGLLRKGPGICHGVAGSGYVFLLLYRLTSDEKHWHRALKFAQFMQSSEFTKARTPDRPYSLFEGLAGTVCFLTDLMQPNRSEFPFFNVFV